HRIRSSKRVASRCSNSKVGQMSSDIQTGQRPRLRYEDQPTLAETFSDSIGNWSFDGSTLRIEFLVSRLDAGQGDGAPTGRVVPACRIVLSAAGAVELLKTCSQVTTALAKAGLIRPHTMKEDKSGN